MKNGKVKRIFQKREKFFIQRDLINKGESKDWESKDWETKGNFSEKDSLTNLKR